MVLNKPKSEKKQFEDFLLKKLKSIEVLKISIPCKMVKKLIDLFTEWRSIMGFVKASSHKNTLKTYSASQTTLSILFQIA